MITDDKVTFGFDKGTDKDFSALVFQKWTDNKEAIKVIGMLQGECAEYVHNELQSLLASRERVEELEKQAEGYKDELDCGSKTDKCLRAIYMGCSCKKHLQKEVEFLLSSEALQEVLEENAKLRKAK